MLTLHERVSIIEAKALAYQEVTKFLEEEMAKLNTEIGNIQKEVEDEVTKNS